MTTYIRMDTLKLILSLIPLQSTDIDSYLSSTKPDDLLDFDHFVGSYHTDIRVAQGANQVCPYDYTLFKTRNHYAYSFPNVVSIMQDHSLLTYANLRAFLDQVKSVIVDEFAAIYSRESIYKFMTELAQYKANKSAKNQFNTTTQQHTIIT